MKYKKSSLVKKILSSLVGLLRNLVKFVTFWYPLVKVLLFLIYFVFIAKIIILNCINLIVMPFLVNEYCINFSFIIDMTDIFLLQKRNYLIFLFYEADMSDHTSFLAFLAFIDNNLSQLSTIESMKHLFSIFVMEQKLDYDILICLKDEKLIYSYPNFAVLFITVEFMREKTTFAIQQYTMYFSFLKNNLLHLLRLDDVQPLKNFLNTILPPSEAQDLHKYIVYIHFIAFFIFIDFVAAGASSLEYTTEPRYSIYQSDVRIFRKEDFLTWTLFGGLELHKYGDAVEVMVEAEVGFREPLSYPYNHGPSPQLEVTQTILYRNFEHDFMWERAHLNDVRMEPCDTAYGSTGDTSMIDTSFQKKWLWTRGWFFLSQAQLDHVENMEELASWDYLYDSDSDSWSSTHVNYTSSEEQISEWSFGD